MTRICMVTSIHPDFDARIYKMAKSVAEMEFKIDLVCPWDVKEQLQDGIYFRPFPKAKDRISRYKNYNRIWKEINKPEYDIYHFHDLDLVPLFTLFKILKGKHVIYDMHENYPEEMWHKPYLPTILKPITSLLVRLIEWFGIRAIHNVVVVEDNQEENFAAPDTRILKVRNFASKQLANGRNDDYETRPDGVIFTGSHYESNGSLVFLEIARIVHRNKPEVNFYCIDRFAGDLRFKNAMLDKIKEYGLEKIIKFLPNLAPQDIMQHLNLATIALAPTLDLPRHRKAIPNKLFEYMAAGIPVIASSLPYNIEFIQNSGSGFVADPSNPADFAERILQLCNDRKLAKDMGQNGIKAFETNYNWETEASRLKNYYHNLY